MIQTCPPHELINLQADWPFWARPAQLPPEGDWDIWLFIGGRGAGKTRAGAQWVNDRVRRGARRIGIVAPSYSDAREVMIFGESGLAREGFEGGRPIFESSRRRLIWPNGAIGYVFSGQDPDGLRGPQCDTVWADEFCAWAEPEQTLANLRLGLRLGPDPRLMITTTPRPTPALLGLLDGGDGGGGGGSRVALTHASTFDNAANLSPGFIRAMQESYGGTRLARQELAGEVLRDFPGALWTLSTLEAAREKSPSQFDKIVIAVDPPVTSGAGADACGLIVAGRVGAGRGAMAYILFDGTVQGFSPERWARRAAELHESWQADYILAEVNQGGEMVTTLISTVDSTIAVKTVFARNSKTARAEPVAALYEQGRVKHCGVFSALEDELCRMGAQIGKAQKSPDRADALVWAVTDLLLNARAEPSIRGL